MTRAYYNHRQPRQSPPNPHGYALRARPECPYVAPRRQRRRIPPTPLESISRRLAQETMKRLEQGFRNSAGQAFGPAKKTREGCTIVKKKTGNSYCQICPRGTVTQFTAQRVAIIAYKGLRDRKNLLYNGMEASHLCNKPKCVTSNHLTVEPHDANMARKDCEQGPTLQIETKAQTHEVLSPHECNCSGANCIPKILHAVACYEKLYALCTHRVTSCSCAALQSDNLVSGRCKLRPNLDLHIGKHEVSEASPDQCQCRKGDCTPQTLTAKLSYAALHPLCSGRRYLCACAISA
ncbi:unnamed protein product [Periconia digitata]|uniref:Zinc-binding loop region of homing endonuclease domain-containing protein n=1 Tax=Periconia digitata TaxID=1303443 RepID=A0A9W4XSL3_9PLEO|nr:unnamed protein product [Periconia digitata]